MSHLLCKSNQNLEAAGFLISGKNFAPSVHCAYYSLIQFALASLFEKDQMTVEGLISKHSTSRYRSSLHASIRAELLDRIKTKDKYGYTSFNTSFNKLKMQREDSDYKDVEISEYEAVNAIRCSKELKKQLQKIGI
jgi:uncharacterized protein (UPF0332 family)